MECKCRGLQWRHQWWLQGNHFWSFGRGRVWHLKIRSRRTPVQSSQTETQGRVHTGAATVIVLPEAEEFDIELDMSEFNRTNHLDRSRWTIGEYHVFAIKLHHEPGHDRKLPRSKSSTRIWKKIESGCSRLWDGACQRWLIRRSARAWYPRAIAARKSELLTTPGKGYDHRINLTLYDLGTLWMETFSVSSTNCNWTMRKLKRSRGSILKGYRWRR